MTALTSIGEKRLRLLGLFGIALTHLASFASPSGAYYAVTVLCRLLAKIGPETLVKYRTGLISLGMEVMALAMNMKFRATKYIHETRGAAIKPIVCATFGTSLEVLAPRFCSL